jgi:hypothetical protein
MSTKSRLTGLLMLVAGCIDQAEPAKPDAPAGAEGSSAREEASQSREARDWKSPLDCEQEPVGRLIAGVTYRSEPAHVGLGLQHAYPTPSGGLEPHVGIVGSSTGELDACEFVASSAACERALRDVLQPTPECAAGGACESFLVIVSDEGVVRIDGLHGLLDEIGPIDSPQEAALVAYYTGHQLNCPMDFENTSGTEARSTDDGFEIRTEWDSCGLILRESTHVTTDGEVTPIEVRHVVRTSSCAPTAATQ